jgi:hypothetical protein
MIDLPMPQEDQLFYDFCGCYGEMMLFPHEYTVKKALFNTRWVKASTGFPSHLEFMCNNTYSDFTPDYYINYHTTFPFYQPFLSTQKENILREQMKGSKLGPMQPQLGLGASGINEPTFLQYCPACITNEREKFGRGYWRRSHQLPGLGVCVTHRCWLEESSVPAHGINGYITAECALPENLPIPRFIDLGNLDDRIVLDLAEDAVWLLNHPQPSDVEGLNRRYVTALAEHGWATYKGSLYPARFTEAFLKRFPVSILKKLGCEIEDRHPRHWLARWLEKDLYVHPLRHLLVITLLGYRAESFFALSREWKPFGDPPWPCLNPVCDHHTNSVITDVVLGFSRRVRRKPLGTFICSHCGFSYCRVGPDSNESDRFRIGRVRSHGQLWETRLRYLMKQFQGNVSAVAKELMCSSDTVVRHAERLEKNDSIAGEQCGRLPTSVAVEQYRNAWIQALNDYPECGLVDLLVFVPEIYSWLDRHDSEWLKANKPPRRLVHRSRIDWDDRDKAIVDRLFKLVDTIKQDACPRRVTLNAIAHHLGYSDVIFRRDIRKLPRTFGIIPYVLESPEAFVVRRVQLAATKFCTDGIPATPSELIKAAGVSREMQTKSIIELINNTCEQIRQALLF